MALTVGNTYKRVGTVTLTPAALLTTAQADQSVTITGLQTDDIIVFNPEALDTGLIVSHSWVSAANTAKIRLYNPTGSTITPVSQTFKYVVL